MKSLIRNLVLRIPGLRFWVARWIFLRHRNPLRYWGVFPSYAQARAYTPRHLKDVKDPLVSDKFVEAIPEMDLETVRILSPLIPKAKTVFDLGGNVGLCFYRYRAEIPYPADLRWIVAELPHMIEGGQRIARQRGETQITFTDDLAEGSGADVYLTCGALQYFKESFAELLGKLKDKPLHIVVNRVPMSPYETFFTLQHTTYHILPYRIENRDEFIASIKELGYELVETWQNDRVCDIILRPDRFVEHYYGFYFKKAGA